MLAEDLLPAAQLGVERDERAVGQVGVEVGEEADGVGQLDAVLERGAALVVDEHERELVGRVRRGESRDVALEQLALAGAGGAGGQAVRTVAAQVHVDDPGRSDADRRAEPGVVAVGLPPLLHPDRVRLLHLEQVEQERLAGHVTRERRRRDIADGGEVEGHLGGGVERDAVADDAGDGVAGRGDRHRHLVGQLGGVHDRTALAGQVLGRRGAEDGVDPELRSAGEHAGQRRAGDVDGTRDDEQDLRGPEGVAEADVALGLDAPLGDEVVDDLEHRSDVIALGPHRAAARHPGQQRLGVGEPPGPGPLVGAVARGEHHDGQVARRVEGGGLHDQPAQQRISAGIGTGDAEHADAADVEVDGHRRIDLVLGHHRVDLRLEVLVGELGVALLVGDVGGQIGDADPNRQEVADGRPPLPELGRSVVGQRQQVGGARRRGPSGLDHLVVAGGDGGVERRHLLVELLLGLAVRLVPAAPVLPHRPDHHHRAHEAEQQHDGAHEDGHHATHEDGQHRGQQRDLALARCGGRLGQLHRDRRERLAHPGRAVEVEVAGPVGDLGLAHDGEGVDDLHGEQRGADLDELTRLQRLGALEASAVHDRAVGRAEVGDGDVVAPDAEVHVAARRLVVGEGDGAGLVAADLVGSADLERDAPPGVGATHDEQLVARRHGGGVVVGPRRRLVLRAQREVVALLEASALGGGERIDGQAGPAHPCPLGAGAEPELLGQRIHELGGRRVGIDLEPQRARRRVGGSSDDEGEVHQGCTARGRTPGSRRSRCRRITA